MAKLTQIVNNPSKIIFHGCLSFKNIIGINAAQHTIKKFTPKNPKRKKKKKPLNRSKIWFLLINGDSEIRTITAHAAGVLDWRNSGIGRTKTTTPATATVSRIWKVTIE